MKKVLVIDDCEEFLESIWEQLREADFEVEVACSADEAMELVAATNFDLVICDLVLPTGFTLEDDDSAMVGVHTIHQLRTKCPELPIIAVSGHLGGEALKGIKQFGAVACLEKPFGMEQLLSAVNQALTTRN